MEEPKRGSTLADRIEAAKPELAADFAAAARIYGAAQSLSAEEVIDNLEVLLDELVAALRAGALPPHASVAAMLHAEQRFRCGYDLAAMMREYGALRDVLSARVARAEREGYRLTARDAHVLYGFVVATMADAASRHAALTATSEDRATTEHLAFLAHELRNALGSASMAVSLLEAAGAAPPASNRALASLSRAIPRALRLVDDSLVTVKLRALEHLDRQPLDLRQFLEDVSAESALDAETKGVTLVGSATGTATVDAKALRSAVSNLIRNAVKFTPAGGRVEVKARADDGRLVVEVADACGGIPESMVQRLFDPFVQAGQDRSGFGLGLAIARQVALAHEGQIRVHNLPGHGCVFVLDLPREPPPSAGRP